MNNHDRSHHPERAQRVQELFIELVELPADERKHRLKEVALEDATLANEVESLLAHHKEDSSFLEDGDALKINLGETQIWRTPPVIPGFQVIRQVAEGGQAVVFQGRQESTNQLVAIKVLKDNLLGDKSAQSRHLEEIRTLTRIQHPNIVSIVDCGVTADGREYYITRYISGYNLDEYIKEKSPKLEQRVALCAKIARAVDAAHKSGIIHRDLKPSNIRIDRHGEPYVLDFGLAKGTDGQSSVNSGLKTVPGSFVGSVPWATPEQVNKKFGKISARTDIYQLGVVFYQVFASGEFPYPVTGELLEAFHSIVDVSPKPLPDAGNDKKLARIETVLRKALNKKPNDRFSSARAFARMLEQSISIAAHSHESTSHGASRLSFASWVFLMILFLGGISGAGYVLDKYVIPGEITNFLTELREKTLQAAANGTNSVSDNPGSDGPDDQGDDVTPNEPDKQDRSSASPPPEPPEEKTEIADASPRIEPGEQDDSSVSPPSEVPTVSIEIGDAEIDEADFGTASLVFPVTLSKKSTETIRVRYATSSQTSRTSADEQDYQPAENGTLTFAPGDTEQSIEVKVVGDQDYEPNETFSVQLLEPENAVISRDIGIGTILNDDRYPATPGKLDFQLVDSGKLPDDWETIGNTGIELTEDLPALKVIASGKDENAFINHSIRVADEFFLEMQLVDRGNNYLEFTLTSSETGETSTFQIGTKSASDWTLTSGSSIFGNLAPSSSASRDVVWFRIENRPDDGRFLIVNGDRRNGKKIGNDLKGPFDSLTVRFHDDYQQMAIHNLRWGPISPTPGLQTVEFGTSRKKVAPFQLPDGWTLIGPSNPTKRTRWISDPLQIGDEFLASFRINVLRRGEFQLNFIGEGGSTTLPVGFDFKRGVAVVSACGSQRNFDYRLTNYEVTIRRRQDELLVTIGDPSNTLVVDAQGLGNFEQLELDVSSTDEIQVSGIWIKSLAE